MDWLRPTVLLLFVSFCLGCKDGPYVMHEEFVQSGGITRYLGGACEQVAEGQTSGTGAGGENLSSYAFELRGTRDGVEAVLSARQRTAASRAALLGGLPAVRRARRARGCDRRR